KCQTACRWRVLHDGRVTSRLCSCGTRGACDRNGRDRERVRRGSKSMRSSAPLPEWQRELRSSPYNDFQESRENRIYYNIKIKNNLIFRYCVSTFVFEPICQR